MNPHAPRTHRARLVLAPALSLLAACGGAADVTFSDEEPQVTEESGLVAGYLSAGVVNGGLSSFRWRGHELSVGGVYYGIASCTGADSRTTNLDTKHGVGVMRAIDGAQPCGTLRYTQRITGGNPFTVHYDIGPMPVKMGAVALAFDLDKGLFGRFDFNNGSGWWEGCANNWQHVTSGIGDTIANIRRPCTIMDRGTVVGAVGEATRPMAAGARLTLHSPLAQVTRNVTAVSVISSGGANLPMAHPYSTKLAGEVGFVNHPGTASFGGAFFNVPAGATIHFEEKISVADPDVRSHACGTIKAGTVLTRGEFVNSCDGRYRLVHQTDGNVVLYRLSDSRARWHTHTDGKPTSTFAVQGDGNLVIYSARGGYFWTAGIPGHSGARLVVQNDGNLVMYDANGRAYWATGTENF